MTEEGNGKICPTCKGEVPEGMSFCGFCGARLSGDQEKQAQAKHGIISDLMNEVHSTSSSLSKYADEFLGSIRTNFIDPYLSYKKRVTMWTLIIITVMLVLTAFLTYEGDISSQVFAFLIGAMTGFLLTTLAKTLSIMP